MKNILRLSSLLAVAALTACGGGGGSGGTSAQQYSISLTTVKTQLPINIDPSNNLAGTGAYAPYSTSLYVSAQTGGKPIPGGTDIFACNMASGLDSGALYYLDGDTSHEVDGKPGAYRAITLGSNSGGASFHFHSSNQAGTARIVCTVVDPRDKITYSANVDIQVGAATGKPAWVIGQAQAASTLGTSDNLANLSNTVGIQASLYDDANQPIATASAANLQVSILPFTSSSSDASVGAQLVAGSQKSSSVRVQSIGGTAQFSLMSGANEGPILLQFVADRSDNNVANGIQDPVTSYLAVGAYDTLVSNTPLAIATTAIADVAVNGVPYSSLLQATGGNAPYTWRLVGGNLPTGLSLNSVGMISGTPSVKRLGSYTFLASVTDRLGATIQQSFSISVTGDVTVDAPLTLNLNTCTTGTDINSTCRIPAAGMGSLYQYGFSATGGDPTVPVTWTFSGLPAWLSSSSTGGVGFVSGTPTYTKDPETGIVTGNTCAPTGFLVTATRGSLTASKRVTLAINAGELPCP